MIQGSRRFGFSFHAADFLDYLVRLVLAFLAAWLLFSIIDERLLVRKVRHEEEVCMALFQWAPNVTDSTRVVLRMPECALFSWAPHPLPPLPSPLFP